MKWRENNSSRKVRGGNRTRQRTAVLLSAVSLLGTSLGVSAAPPGPVVPPEQGSRPQPAFDGLAERDAGAVVRIASNQLKWRSDQFKTPGESRALNFTKPGEKGQHKSFPTESIKPKPKTR
jgi:hypothetical protein